MKLNKSSLYYSKELISKIMFLVRLSIISSGPIFLYTTDKRLKFVMFIVALLSGREIFFKTNLNKSTDEILHSNITMFYTDVANTPPITKHYNFIGKINVKELFNKGSYYSFLSTRATNVKLYKEYDEVRTSLFKDERQAFIRKLETVLKYGLNNVITLGKKSNQATYTPKNIKYMLDAVNSEFGEEELLHVNFQNTKIEIGFIYMLYFFLRGDYVYLNDSAHAVNLVLNKKIRSIYFYDSQSFKNKWDREYKYGVYSKLSIFAKTHKLFNWINIFNYQKILNIYKKDEMILINPNTNSIINHFLRTAKSRVSIIYGFQADGYTLAINRRLKRKAKNIVTIPFHIMNGEDSIKIFTDSLHRLYISSKKIPNNLKTEYAIDRKNDYDKYYLTDTYAHLDGETLTVLANKEDIYYDSKGKAIFNLYLKRKWLEIIPYLREVEILKYKDDVKAVLALDTSFIAFAYAFPNFTHVLKSLQDKINQLNETFLDGYPITKTVISNSFFTELHLAENKMTKFNYFNYLNQ